jgi:hypothetical protein
MTTRKDYISGVEKQKVTQWDRSGGDDTIHTRGDDTKKMDGEKNPESKEDKQY